MTPTSVDHKTSSNAVLSEEDYVNDYAGNLTSKTVDSVTTTYSYDDIDQLLSKSRTGYSASYTYDANGNRASKTLGGTTEVYTNDDADKLTEIKVSGVTVKSFGYDGAGRTTSVVTGAGTTTVAYDYEGRISQITYPSTATNTFAYNGLDTRVSKVDSAGTSTYKRDGAHVTAPVISDGSAVYTPGISERRSSTTKFYGSDRLGTNALETNSSQAVTATKTYDAFGMPVASTGSSASPFGFAGQHGYQEDADSGLKLLGHRYYDASTGRFLTRDPVKDGRNWYGYCDNNPLTQVDPDGLDAAAIEKRARKIVEDPDERKNYNDRYDDPKWDSGKSNKNTDCATSRSGCASVASPTVAARTKIESEASAVALSNSDLNQRLRVGMDSRGFPAMECSLLITPVITSVASASLPDATHNFKSSPSAYSKSCVSRSSRMSVTAPCPPKCRRATAPFRSSAPSLVNSLRTASVLSGS